MIIICFFIAAIFVLCFSKKIYSSTIIFYIKNDSPNKLTNDDIKAGEMLKEDYLKIIKSTNLLNEVKEHIIIKYPEYKNLTADNIKNSIKIIANNETRMLKLEIEADNANIAAEVANLLIVSLKNQMDKILQTKKISIVEKAKVDNIGKNPNYIKGILIYTIIGSCLAIIIVNLIIIFIFEQQKPL